MVHWEDVKADMLDVFNEFKKHRIGWIGVALITFMVILGVLAPYLATGVPDDWRAGADRWNPNPSQAPPAWIDWITREDYARQEEISEWDDYDSRYIRSAPAERDFSISRMFDELGTREIQLTHLEDDDYELDSTEVEVVEREGIEYLNVTDFSVELMEGEDFEYAPTELDISANIEHNGTFEAGGAEDREFTLGRTEYDELEPSPEEGEISETLQETLIENIDYLEDDDLDGAELTEEDGYWYVVVDEERELRIDVPDEFSFSLDRTDYEDHLKEGYVSPGLRRAFEDEIEDTLDDHVFSLPPEEPLEDGPVPEWLRENITDEHEDLAEEAELREIDGEWRIILRQVDEDRWNRELTLIEETLYRVEETNGELNIYEFNAQLYEQYEKWWISLDGSPEYRIEVEDQELDIWDVGGIDVYGKAIRDIELELPEGETIAEEYEGEWSLAPEDQVEVEVIHRFRFDGVFSLHLGDQSEFFRIGIGNDISIDDFSVETIDEDEWIYRGTAEVSSLVDSERDIRMRIDRMEDGEYLGEVDTRDWELDAFAEETLEWEYNFDAEGEYAFVIGDEEVELDLQEEEEDEEEDTEAASSLSSLDGADEDYSSTSDGSMAQAQQQELRGSITLDTDEVTQGGFVTISVDLINEIEEEQTAVLRIDGEEFRRVIVAPGGEMDRHTFTFTYDMDYDRVPRELYLDFNGFSSRYARRIIQIERPDSDELGERFPFVGNEGRLELERLDRGDRVGEISEQIRVSRRMGIRQSLHDDASTYLSRHAETDFENLSVVPSQVINPMNIIFSEANENWLSEDPDPLKGEYEITVMLEGADLEIDEDETSVHIGGAVFGVFGTDRAGRDLFLGWMWGARYGLYAGGLVALSTILLSTTYGMTSAYYGGWVDELMSRLQEIAMGIPTLPILIILLRFWEQSINVFVLIYMLLSWRGAARVIRARGLQVAQDTYIEAAESLGSGSSRIIFKHMIPQILPYSIAQAALLVPVVIMAEAGMHILGLGDPNIVTWGTILNDARSADALMNWEQSWFWILFPGIGMMLIGFGFISTGMAIERIINPEMRQR